MKPMAMDTKLSISDIAAKLDQPFEMANVAFVGDIVVSVYICEGALAWHRHLDIDELFWVHKGSMLLESEWGDVQLRPGELAVVPKGVGHRSSATSRTTVMLIRCGFVPKRKNGRRRLYALSGEGKLKPISLPDAARAFAWPFRFQTVARVDGSVLQTAWGVGTWPVGISSAHDALLLVLKGTATLRTSAHMLHMHPGDFTVLSQGTVFQLSTTQSTVLARVIRDSTHPASPQGGTADAG